MECENIKIKKDGNEIYNFKNGKQLACLLSTEAEETAKYFKENDIIKTTQYRKFYDQVLKLLQKAQNCNDFEVEILPFIKMLISKAQYSANRKACKYGFVKFMKSCIKGIENKDDLKNFKLFLEAILGYMPK